MIREILIENIYDILKLPKSNIQRIELNSCLYLGGLTPSIGKIRKALDLSNIPIAIMIRPRAGGFIYSELEIEEMKRDILEIGKLNVEAFVFGILDENLSLSDKNKELIDLCHNLGKKAVLSRAFDNTISLRKSIEKVNSFKFDRILTSGFKENAIDSLEKLKYIRDKINKNIGVVAASGISDKNICIISEKTGISEFHASLKKERFEKSNFVNVDFSYLENKDMIYELDEKKLERFIGVKKWKN